MELEKAKEILSAYQPDNYDSSDTLMEEALALAETNMELKKWFEDQLALDAQMFKALKGIPKISESQKEALLGNYRDVPDSKTNWFRQGIAIAAIFLVVLMGLGIGHYSIYRSNFGKFESFRSAMSYLAQSPYLSLDIKTNDLSELQLWLEARNLTSWTENELPRKILQDTPLGCAEINWRALSISLTCFHNSDGDIIHLFAIDSHPNDDSLISGIEQLTRTHGLQSIGWETDNKVFLLMGSKPHVDINEYFMSEV